jgi:hypothetical protein
MRLKRLPEIRLPQDAPIAPLVGGDGTPAASPTPLDGSWGATRWEYRSLARADSVLDLVCDRKATVTLSLSDDRYILTWSLADGEAQSLAGRYAVRDGEIEFQHGEPGTTERVSFRFGARELSLSSEGSGWDFSGDGGEEPAGFVAVLVRL